MKPWITHLITLKVMVLLIMVSGCVGKLFTLLLLRDVDIMKKLVELMEESFRELDDEIEQRGKNKAKAGQGGAKGWKGP